jgi:hypothetical protein
VDGEVVGRGPKGIADDAGILGGDILDGQAHVRRQLAPAAPAESVAYGLIEIATRTTTLLREIG